MGYYEGHLCGLSLRLNRKSFYFIWDPTRLHVRVLVIDIVPVSRDRTTDGREATTKPRDANRWVTLVTRGLSQPNTPGGTNSPQNSSSVTEGPRVAYCSYKLCS